MINYIDKTISFYHNGKMIAKKIPDGLKNSPNSLNVTNIALLENRKGMVTDVNLITYNVTPDEMVAITSCQSFPEKGPHSGAW